jgi:hypothetical protein
MAGADTFEKASSRRTSLLTLATRGRWIRHHTPASSLGNFPRTPATPEPIKHRLLTSLKKKLVKIGANVVSHDRYVAVQMAEVAIARTVFAEILQLIVELRPQPTGAPE